MQAPIQGFNDKNMGFYQNIKMETFKHLAGVIGFDTAIDVELLFPIVKNAKVLLELGAGYGRVVKALLARGFAGKIIAVERVTSFINHLKLNIPEIVVLQQQDIKHLELKEKADAITWLWSGILELSKEEQAEVVKHLYSLMNESGVLVLEIPRKVKFVGVMVGEQKIKVETEWGSLDAYLPKHEEMLEYGKNAGFASVEQLDYQTATHLDRSMYVMRK